jgi:hypothetical protein
LLRRLAAASVEFVVVGGLAGSARGAARATYDLDICYARDAENLERLVAALSPIRPYLRGAPPGLPFRLSVATLQAGLNFTLTTDDGAIDLLGEITGAGDYGRLLPHSTEEELFGVRCRCATLPALIRMKRAAGRPKDFEAIAELEALLEETERQ